MSPNARSARAEIARLQTFSPVLSALGNQLAARRPFEGRTVGVVAHLTAPTAALLLELQLGGGRFVVAGAAEATTDQEIVRLLRDEGLTVHTPGARAEAQRALLDEGPEILADAGGDLIGTLMRWRPEAAGRVRGAAVLGRSAARRLAGTAPPFPVVDLTAGTLKVAVENRTGVGLGVWQAVQALTGLHLAGRRVAVLGYGPVGQGVAAAARAMGAQVDVVELDPVRRLLAHYDGFGVPTLGPAVGAAGVLVTCTGVDGALPVEALLGAREGLVLANAGHGGHEVDVPGIAAVAARVDEVAEGVTRYQLSGGPTVTVLGGGHPVNIVMNAGSPEPLLLLFGLLGLTLADLAENERPAGVVAAPQALEAAAAALALHALGADRG